MTAAASVGAAVADARRRLAGAGVSEAALDARLLAAAALCVTPAEVFSHPERPLRDDDRRALDRLVARRAGREPLAHIVGHREFWSLSLAVTRDTLIPRPESETVVEAALAHVRDRDAPLSVLDLGTGSGCLLLALLSELPRARGVGVDISGAALGVALANADALGLGDRTRLVEGGWDAVGGRYDLIVANPPYVADGDLDGLAPEVARFEPRRALAAGIDGLDAFRAVVPLLPRRLAAGGAAFLEVGAGQAEAVAAMARQQGMQVIEIKKDLSGLPRCVAVASVAASAKPVENRKKGVGMHAFPD